MAAPILIYGINYQPEPIGVGRYTADLGRFLAGRGHDVRVVTAPPHYPGWRVKPPYRAWAYASERLAGAAVIRCPIAQREGARGLWRLVIPASFAASSAPVAIWQILRHRPRAVLCVEPTLLGAPAALLAARLVGSRTVLHVQDLEVDAAFAMGHLGGGLAAGLARAFERAVLSRFDAVVTISEQMKARLVGKGVPDARLSVVRNWVDLDVFRPMPATGAYRAELGLPPETFVALYSGHIGVKQGLPVLLDAARLLADEASAGGGPAVAVVVCGDGPEKERLVASYGGLPNVRFLPLQPEARLGDFLSFADLHVIPQRAASADLVLPSKLGGALASGRPLLVTADPGTELHGFLDGFADLVPSGDVAAVAAAIRRRAADRRHDPAPGLALAASLSAGVGLPRFEAILLGDAVGDEARPPLLAEAVAGVSGERG